MFLQQKVYFFNMRSDWKLLFFVFEDRDQIVISCPHMDEIYVIDHSLTMEEAKTAAGDFLWRWGKPTNYGRGSSDDQSLSFPHDAHWVDIELESDHPDYGKIAVFSNRAGDDYSSAHLITVGPTYAFTPDVIMLFIQWPKKFFKAFCSNFVSFYSIDMILIG